MKKASFTGNLFQEELEQTAIERIRKFAKIAKTMGFEVRLGFSGGKDSQVCYDLCKRSGIEFRAFFNHSFESNVTLRFIREHYPEVIWRRDHPYGFIRNIWKKHNGMLPDTRHAYCCQDYKHNHKYSDKASIIGVRKAESAKRRSNTAFMAKNKTIKKKNNELFNEYFAEHCQSEGANSIIQLMPIIDWTDANVWDYIKAHNLPVNPEYKKSRRVGCIVCPKANLTSNYIWLMKMPKLIDAFIMAREKAERDTKIAWVITSENKDYSDDKPYYICRWLNHSFMPFTKKQEQLYKEVRAAYDTMKQKKAKESAKSFAFVNQIKKSI